MCLITLVGKRLQAYYGLPSYSIAYCCTSELNSGDNTVEHFRDYVLSQRGTDKLYFSTREKYQRGEDNGFVSGSQLANLTVQSRYAFSERKRDDETLDYELVPLSDDEVQAFSLKANESQRMTVAGEQLVIQAFKSLSWAKTVGRDQYGLWADTDIAGIQHRFRWIEPTSFMMGSPEDEKGRYDSETLHEVILTQGYWLAETTCTQELWQAVTGNNPSEFKGKDKPVERVSWEDINNQFLAKLNKQQPELALRLPTEAEWENACKAGTTTAFNFEKEISLDQFNYRGTWDDYDNYGEGAFKQTTEVKKYQPNRWGLYQMHGNVLEWCNDWYGDYPADQVIDPTGSESGANRVLRGGSWFNGGRNCRSAGRNFHTPDDRLDSIGFRLARGQRSLVQSVRADQQPDGSHVSGAHGAQLGDGQRAQDFAEQKNKPAKKGLFRQIKDRITKK